MTIDSLIADWDGLAVVTHRDPGTGAWIFIALHDDTLGVPVGGTRLKVYDELDDALRDALRLAEGMTHKWAAVELDSGGGKAVIAVPRPVEGEERRGLLRRYGELLNSLRGSFGTGQDLGITPEDMLVVAAVTPFVHCCDTTSGIARDAGPFTARGVVAAIRATLRRLDGEARFEGARVHIEGVGDVGAPLARMLAAKGVELLLSDVDDGCVRALAAELDATVVPVGELPECDVHAPCAVGATLNRETVPRLRCRGVAGSANNQLATAADAELLHERAILYAPDYVANAGGAIGFGLLSRGVCDEEAIGARIDGIADSLGAIFASAAERDESPLHGARARVAEVLGRARAARALP